MTQPVAPAQRHSHDHRCPICGGRDEDPRGSGRRCNGYTSSDGEWVRCSRDEHAGRLDADDYGLFVHRMYGACKCGTQHGPARERSGGASSRQIDATYDYKDESGRVLFQVVRFAGKQFRQRRPDPSAESGWSWKLGDARRVLYRLPDLIAALKERTADPVYIVEGEKDVDALWKRGLVATCNPHGAGKWKAVTKQAAAELAGRDVIVIADADEPGRKHARAVAGSLAKAARSVAVLELTPHKDVGDWLAAGGDVAELPALAANAATMDEPAAPADELAPRRGLSVVVGGLREIALCPHRETECADATIKELAAKALGLYQRAGMLVRVTRDKPPSGDGPQSPSVPRIGTMPNPVLRELIDAAVTVKTEKGGDYVPDHPPAWFVELISARGEWADIRRLEGVTQSPVMRPDGTVLTAAGYDPETGLLYEPNFAPLDLRECPTIDDALAALAELREVICDFPFAGPEHEAGYLSLLLTPFARFAFRGPAPLGVLDGSVAGVGKGKLVQVISVLVDGCEMSPTPQPEEAEEEKKCITSTALAGNRFVLLDNVTLPIGSGPLEALLTSTRWRNRLLGGNLNFDGDVLTQWFVTGNNVQFRKKDTIRRTVHVRIESPSDQPEARTDFAHPDLLEWVRSERPRLVRAALTILRAHALAGYPNPCKAQWGSFEGWSDRVRAALVWLGMADPADTRTELAVSADTEGRALGVLLACLRQKQVIGGAMLARELLDAARGDDDLREALEELCPTRRGAELSARLVARNLRSVKGRVINVDGQMLALGTEPGPGHSVRWLAEVPGKPG